MPEPESFVAGPENALVHALLRAIDDNEPSFSPIVLWGPGGVGKSTLAEALAARWRERHREATTIFTTGGSLAQSLAHAIETGATVDFRSRHHRCELLLIDDVHQLVGKTSAQQFLVTALDSLAHRPSLVIATLRKAPQHTAGLMPTLCSRLAGGLVVSLAFPGFLARQELVRQTAARVSLSLDDAILKQLVGTPQRPARGFVTAAQLRHAVLQLGAANLPGRQGLDQSLNELLAETPETKHVCQQVAVLVAKQTGLSVQELRGPSRRQAVAEARSLAMYVARNITGASYAAIGRCFGGRDHTTVLYACRKMTATLATSAYLQQSANDLATQVMAGNTS